MKIGKYPTINDLCEKCEEETPKTFDHESPIYEGSIGTVFFYSCVKCHSLKTYTLDIVEITKKNLEEKIRRRLGR